MNRIININQILKYRPNVNVVMLLCLFTNAIAFDSLYWMMEAYMLYGEVSLIKWLVYTIAFILTLTAFVVEFKRLNKRNGVYMIDDFGIGYGVRNWNKKE